MKTDGSKFDGSKFDGARFDGANFDGAQFDGSKFDGSKKLHLVSLLGQYTDLKKCWPIQGQAGFLWVVKGEVMCTLLDSSEWDPDSSDVTAELAKRTAKDSMKHDALCILEAGQCVYVPEGWWCLTYGLSQQRPTTLEAPEIHMAKKASKKKLGGGSKDGRQFCTMMWLPMLAECTSLSTIGANRLYAELRGNQQYLTKGIVEDSSWKTLMANLQAVSEKMSSETLAPPQVLEKALKKQDSEVSQS